MPEIFAFEIEKCKSIAKRQTELRCGIIWVTTFEKEKRSHRELVLVKKVVSG